MAPPVGGLRRQDSNIVAHASSDSTPRTVESSLKKSSKPRPSAGRRVSFATQKTVRTFDKENWTDQLDRHSPIEGLDNGSATGATDFGPARAAPLPEATIRAMTEGVQRTTRQRAAALAAVTTTPLAPGATEEDEDVTGVMPADMTTSLGLAAQLARAPAVLPLVGGLARPGGLKRTSDAASVLRRPSIAKAPRLTPISSVYTDPEQEEANDDGMDMTVAVGGIVAAAQPATPAAPAVDDMEFTRAVGGIVAAATGTPAAASSTAAIPASAKPTTARGRRSIEGLPADFAAFRDAEDADAAADDGMDMTMAVGGIVSALATAVPLSPTEAHDDMKMTRAIGGILATPGTPAAPTPVVERADEGYDDIEMTRAIGGVLATPGTAATPTVPDAAQPDDDNENNEDMEMTRAVGRIVQQATPAPASDEIMFESQEDEEADEMEMTRAVGGIVAAASATAALKARPRPSTRGRKSIARLPLGLPLALAASPAAKDKTTAEDKATEDKADDGMDMTVAVGGIINAQSTPVKLADDMEMTRAVGGILDTPAIVRAADDTEMLGEVGRLLGQATPGAPEPANADEAMETAPAVDDMEATESDLAPGASTATSPASARPLRLSSTTPAAVDRDSTMWLLASPAPSEGAAAAPSSSDDSATAVVSQIEEELLLKTPAPPTLARAPAADTTPMATDATTPAAESETTGSATPSETPASVRSQPLTTPASGHVQSLTTPASARFQTLMTPASARFQGVPTPATAPTAAPITVPTPASVRRLHLTVATPMRTPAAAAPEPAVENAEAPIADENDPAAAIAPVAATLEEVLAITGVRFLEAATQTLNRQSFGGAVTEPIEPPTATNERAKLGAVLGPELNLLRLSCNALDEHSTQTVQSIAEVENVLATSPSPLFYQLEDAVLLEGVLQRVRQARHVARLNARLAYYEWRTQVLMSQQQQLAETRARLERDAHALNEAQSVLVPLKERMTLHRQALTERAAVNELIPALLKANERIAELTPALDQHEKVLQDAEQAKAALSQAKQELEAILPGLRAKTVSTPRATPSDVDAAWERLGALQAVVPWVPRRVNATVFEATVRNRLQVVVDTAHAATPGVATVTVTPFEPTNIANPPRPKSTAVRLPSVVASLSARYSRPDMQFATGTIGSLLRELAEQVSRLEALERELTMLGGYFAIHVLSPAPEVVATAPTMIEVTVINGRNANVATLSILVELPLRYPSAELTMHASCSPNVRHADLEDALLSVPQGPGHLTRLCDLTKRFLSASPV